MAKAVELCSQSRNKTAILLEMTDFVRFYAKAIALVISARCITIRRL
jgi:hypothetical protein